MSQSTRPSAAVAEPRTLFEMLSHSVAQYSERPLFGTKDAQGWRWCTYREFAAAVDHLRGGLAKAGLVPGDHVALALPNGLDWALAAYAAFSYGAVIVPMYPTQSVEEWAFIINDCRARALYVGGADAQDKLLAVTGLCPSLQVGIDVDGADGKSQGFLTRGQLSATGQVHPVARVNVDPNDTACILYTSGTTGQPKGVVLSHDNFMSNIRAIQALVAVDKTDCSVSFLPWAHSFGQTGELHGMISMGAAVAMAESLDRLLANIAEIRPTILFAVPKIFNKLVHGVRAQMAGKPRVIKSLFASGLASAGKKQNGQRLPLGERLALKAADRLIFSKVRQKFGGRLRFAVSGGAPLAKEVGSFIEAIGITVYEGYGLTETSPVVAVNAPRAHRLGTVGRPVPGVEVRIDTAYGDNGRDGEIQVLGPNVMSGYYNRPEETAAVFTADGWFRTGDLGHFDSDGFLVITGRIKELYKLQNGKYISPAPLEEQLKLSPWIANVAVCGAGRPYNVALVVPDIQKLNAWAADQKITADSDEALSHDPRVKRLFDAEVDARSSNFKPHERIRRFVLVREDFTTSNGFLTPTMKLRRRRVEAAYGETIESLYGDDTREELTGAVKK